MTIHGAATRPGTATLAADGAPHREQRTTLADGRTLVLRGERVSAAATRDASPFR